MTHSLPKVLLIEELPLNQDAFASLISSWDDFRLVSIAGTAHEALEMCERMEPDIALIGLELAELSIQLVRRLRSRHPDLRCLVIARQSDARTAGEVIRAGARGFVVKKCSGSELRCIMSQILSSSVSLPSDLAGSAVDQDSQDPVEHLGPREQQVYGLLTAGVKAKDIANHLQLSPKTVASYRASIFRKLNLQTFASLMRFAMERERSLMTHAYDSTPTVRSLAASVGSPSQRTAREVAREHTAYPINGSLFHPR